MTTIAEHVYGDPAGADTMITRLSRLLRSSFVDPEVQEVTLRQELELLQCYLDIARVRFREPPDVTSATSSMRTPPRPR